MNKKALKEMLLGWGNTSTRSHTDRMREIVTTQYGGMVQEDTVVPNTNAVGRHQAALRILGILRGNPNDGSAWKKPTAPELEEALLTFGREYCDPALDDYKYEQYVHREVSRYADCEYSKSTENTTTPLIPLTLSTQKYTVAELLDVEINHIKNAQTKFVTKTTAKAFLDGCINIPDAVIPLRAAVDGMVYYGKKPLSTGDYKAKYLPAVTFSMKYKANRSKKDAEFTGLYFGDIDGVPEEELQNLYDELFTQEGVLGVAYSCRGKGIRAMLCCKDADIHSIHFVFIMLVNNLETVKRIKKSGGSVKVDNAMNTISQNTFLVTHWKAKDESVVFVPTAQVSQPQSQPQPQDDIIDVEFSVTPTAPAPPAPQEPPTTNVASIFKTSYTDAEKAQMRANVRKARNKVENTNTVAEKESITSETQEEAEYTILGQKVPASIFVVPAKDTFLIAQRIKQISELIGRRIVYYEKQAYVFDGTRYLLMEENAGESFLVYITQNYRQKFKTLKRVGNILEKVPLRLSRAEDTAIINTVLDLSIIVARNDKQAGCVWLGKGDCPIDMKNTLFCPSFGYNILTGEKYPYNVDIFCSSYIGIDVDPEAVETPLFDRIVDNALGLDTPNESLLLEMMGYLISPDKTLEVMPVLLGAPRSGKSTIIEALSIILKESAAIDDGTFKSEHGTQALTNARLLVGAELKHMCNEMQDSLKKITGNDRIRVNRKFKGISDVLLPGKVVIVGNVMPKIQDEYILSRMRNCCLTFGNSMLDKEDHVLKYNLLRTELPAILNKCIAGYKRLVQNNFRFTRTQNTDVLVRSIRQDSLPLQTFIETHCMFAENAEIKSLDLYREYEKWCMLNRAEPVGMNKFLDILSTAGKYTKKRVQINGVQAIRLYGVTYIDERIEETPDAQETNVALAAQNSGTSSCKDEISSSAAQKPSERAERLLKMLFG